MLGLATIRENVRPYGMARTPPPQAKISDREALGLAIKRMRRRADLTQDQAAERIGIQPPSYRRYEWGERGLDVEKLGVVATALGSTPEELLEAAREISGGADLQTLPRAAVSGRGLPRPPAPGEMGELPLRERVQAGAWLLADDHVQTRKTFPAARDPRFPDADQWVSEVIGDSMDALRIFEGDFVQCVDAAAIGYVPRTGDVLEVERLRFSGSERELTLKQAEVTAGGVLLWPRSNNARWRDPIGLGIDGEDDIEVRVRGLVLRAIRRF